MSNYHIEDRPGTFDQYIGHTAIVNTLQSLLETGFPRGVIFYGISGTGKTTLAKIVALELAERSNIHYKTVTDYSESKNNSAAGALAEHLSNITRPLYLLTEQAKRGVVLIIDESQQFSSQAQQNLLATIENPDYPNFYFIGCTTNIEKVDKALKNRCVCFNLSDHTISDITLAIKRSLDRRDVLYNEKDLYLIAEAAQGSIRRALTITMSYLHNNKIVLGNVSLSDSNIYDESYVPQTTEDELFLFITYGICKSSLPKIVYLLGLITTLFKEGKSAKSVKDQFIARILLLSDMSDSKTRNKTSQRIMTGDINTINYLNTLLEILEPCDSFSVLRTRLCHFHSKCMK